MKHNHDDYQLGSYPELTKDMVMYGYMYKTICTSGCDQCMPTTKHVSTFDPLLLFVCVHPTECVHACVHVCVCVYEYAIDRVELSHDIFM